MATPTPPTPPPADFKPKMGLPKLNNYNKENLGEDYFSHWPKFDFEQALPQDSWVKGETVYLACKKTELWRSSQAG
jgi:hypothetical protein